jgi:hypothetical protein
MTEVMIDLETLSTENNAVILTIGAIRFNRNIPIEKNIEKCNTFYRRITLESCNLLNLHTCDNTKLWWDKQSPEARYEAFDNPNRISIEKALIEMTVWIRGTNYIWSHGDDFDCVILSNVYKKCGLIVPWKYWNTRDTRTLYDIAKITTSDLPQNNYHHALHDCYRQIIGVQNCLKKIKL